MKNIWIVLLACMMLCACRHFDKQEENVEAVTVTEAATEKSTEVATEVTTEVETEAPTKKEESLKELCDRGYFRYEPLATKDSEKVVELVLPATILLHRDYWPGEEGRAEQNGSAFIYKITPEYVYILTDDHCLLNLSKYTDIVFFNGDRVSRYDVEKHITIDRSMGGDTAMFRVPTEKIAKETLLQLKEIYIDYDVYDKLSALDKAVMIANRFQNGENLVLSSEILGTCVYGGNVGLPGDYMCTYYITPNGTSGTCLVDEYGRLLALSYATVGEYDYLARVQTVKALEDRISELMN